MDKSTNIPVVCFVLSHESKIISTSSTNARSVEWWALNPNCFLYNILFWPKYECNLLYMILSNILRRQRSTDITL